MYPSELIRVPIVYSLQESSPPTNDTRRNSAQDALQLWETLLFISIVMVVALIGITTLRGIRRRSNSFVAKSMRYRDIWEESGRRLQVEAPTSEHNTALTDFDNSADAQTRVLNQPPVSGSRPVVFVTGGAKRVGRAIVESFAASGCDIIFSYNSSSQEALELLTKVRANGVDCHALKLDLSDEQRATKDAAAFFATLPRLDVIVHNASIYDSTPLDANIGIEASRHFRINALAPLMLTQALAPMLAKSTMKGGGSVICMCDIHAMGRPRPQFTAYSMAKAALTEMVYSLARELAPSVRVNGVAPGVVVWPEAGEFADASEQARYLRRVPLGRAGEPSDAANAVRWLALEATYVTGEIIRIDGGRWIT